MATPPVFGPVGSAQPGDLFASRLDLAQRGQHRPRQAGICATQEQGAESIVLSDKYEDDEVHVAYILYTGHGGRSEESGQQVADQTLTKANKGLVRSQVTGLPVRVYRKVALEGGGQAFRYEGLFRVVSRDFRTGKSGFKVFLFRLEPLLSETLAAPPAAKPYAQPEASGGPTAAEPAPRYQATVSRLIRDTAITRQVKLLHSFCCQVCGERLATPAGFYAEAAHIRPLGAPHHGPDALGNVLCLCPNHHVLFDMGSIGVADDYALLGLPGKLHLLAAHPLDLTCLVYHRQHIYRPVPATPE